MSKANIDHLLMQAEGYLRQGQPLLAQPLLGQILDQAPGSRPAMLLQARLQARIGNLSEARNWLGRILAAEPDHVEACRGMAAIGLNSGNMRQAAEWFQRLHRLRPDDPATLYNLALALSATGDKEGAVVRYREAIALKPDYLQAQHNLGNILLRDGRPDEAADCYRQALAVDPDLLEVNYNLGLALSQSKHPAEAAEYFQRTLKLQPDHAGAAFSIGALLQEQGRYEDAITWHGKAIRSDPRHTQAHANLGIACMQIGSYQAAIDHFLAAIRTIDQVGGDANQTTMPPQGSSPTDKALDELYHNLGFIYKHLGRQQEWLDNFRAYELRRIDSLRFAQYGYDVAFLSGDFQRADDLLGNLVAHAFKPGEIDQLTRLLSVIQFTDLPQGRILSLYRQHHDLAMRETGGRMLTPATGRPEGRRLRIGYLSPDFRHHVMGLIMVDVLARHDRERFEVFCYALTKKDDELTPRFVELCDRFVRLDGLNAFAAAQLIAEDRLDILVDLGGLTNGSNPVILAYKPAPVQLTHLGYHGSLGLGTVDYKITDQYADLPGNERFMLEGLLPMAACVMPLHHQEAAANGPTRADLGIAEDTIVFGEFVNIKKLSQRCLETWQLILSRLNNAVLAFSPFHADEQEGFLKRTAAAGIAADRVRFLPNWPDQADARTRYRLLDIVLDTFPYSGGDTTMAALDMAVPVVTLCGTRQSERMTYSILKHLGLDECIAHSREEYVDIACRLAQDCSRRRDLAASIPSLLRDSGMADMARYTANLEQAYRRALQLKGLL